jgi:hypothetical protein
MQIDVRRRFLIDHLEKLDPFLMSMFRQAGAHQAALFVKRKPTKTTAPTLTLILTVLLLATLAPLAFVDIEATMLDKAGGALCSACYVSVRKE